MPVVRECSRVKRRLTSILLLTALTMALSVAPALADSTFAITGRGYGHGIGLSQYGAEGYAAQGSTYAAIVQHYYPSTVLSLVSNAEIRVNVDAKKANRTSWTLRPGAVGKHLIVGGVLAPDTGSIKFVPSGTTVKAYRSSGAYWKTFTSTVLVTQEGTTPSRLVQVVNSSGPYPRVNVVYRGVMRLTVISAGLKLVNALPLESYLYGVIPNESPSGWHAEALKAQAVTARSYAYVTSYPSGSGTPKELYCTTMSQMYCGYGTEQATTNLAVNATKGRVVSYKGKPVQTFFFSSSGGHTADLADVWGPTSAWYWSAVRTGVPDPYEPASGYAHSWGNPILKSGASISAALGFSSPAVSTALVRGTGDFVRQVVIHLANGSVETVTGDRFRSKLGLRSTKFWVSNPATVLPGSTRYEETDGRVTYSGTWTKAAGSRLSGGQHIYSSTVGDSVTIPFTGTSMAWTGKQGAAGGRAEVLIDGVSQGLASQYSTSSSYRMLTWMSKTLTDGPHTLVIRVEGKDAASTDTYVSVDELYVKGSIKRAGTARFEQTDSRITRTGTWRTASNSVMSGGSYSYATLPQATMSIPFSGSTFDLIGATGTSFGKLELLVDGVSKGTFDTYSREWYYRQAIATVTGLTAGSHVATVRVTGTKNPASVGISVGVDAVDALAPPASVRFEETDVRLAFSEGWQSVSSASASAGSMRSTTTPRASSTVKFKGTQVALIGCTAVTFGDVRVMLDGRLVQTLHLKSAATKFRVRLWSTSGLADTTHTVTFEAVGNGIVAVDAVEVTGSLVQADPVGGPAASARYEETAKEVVFSGAWNVWPASPVLSSGAMKWANTAGCAATFTMVGTDFSLIANRAPSYGSARVYVDGKLAGIAQMNAAAISYQQRVFSVACLSPTAEHVVRIEAAGDGTVAVDAIDVRGALQLWTLAQESDPALFWSGTWLSQSSRSLYGGAMKYTTKAGADMTASFTGARVRLISNRAASYGSFLVSVDGAPSVKVSLKAASTAYRQTVWTSPVLADGAHTIYIQAVGDGTVALDRIDVLGELENWLLEEESNPALSWSGTWLSQSSRSLYGGAMKYTVRAGAAMTTSFTGTRVRLISNRSASYGSFLVSVDGAPSVKVSLRAASTAYRQAVWTSPVLASGAHTLRIQAVGDGTVAVDRVDILGPR